MYLTAEVLNLRQILSGKYRFELPWFQRAYAWTDMQAGRLLRDLMTAAGERQYYALGRIFLATPPGSPAVVLIDGHQRLVTLTILFALLRDLISDPATHRSADLCIATRGNNPLMRIQPQPNVAEFFDAMVQRPGQTLTEPPGDIMRLTDSERNIVANRNHLRRIIEQELPDEPSRMKLAAFMLERCLVTVESVENEEDAWSIVSTEEETHVAFHSSERSKVTLVTCMPRPEQEDAARIYDRCQSLVGPDDMCRLLTHIRAINIRRRSSKPVEKELMQRFSLDRRGLAFMQSELRPRCEVMARIKRKRLAEGALGQALASPLETLSWLDNQFWMPPLLHWLSKVPPEHPATKRFIELVDRLAWVMKIAGVDPTDQEQRFLRLLGEIDRAVSPDQMKELTIEPKLRVALVENLQARTFYAKRFSGLVLRRINYSTDPGADRGPVDGDRVTMEHVLPRRPRPGSTWWAGFPNPDIVGDYVNRLGNLLFLTLEENQLAARNEWPEKRRIISESVFAASALTASRYETWTPETIDQRTDAMIEVLLGPWELAPASDRAA